MVWDREMPAGARFYGLGPRVDDTFDLRGRKAETDVPFLVSTTGYGEYHAGAGPFRFDFTGADRYRIKAPRVDYSIYYGPRPKEIFKEHHAANASNITWQVPAEKPVSWTTLARFPAADGAGGHVRNVVPVVRPFDILRGRPRAAAARAATRFPARQGDAGRRSAEQFPQAA